jgi:hypothetical protein
LDQGGGDFCRTPPTLVVTVVDSPGACSLMVQGFSGYLFGNFMGNIEK